MPWILSRLNIRCTSPAKQRDNDSPFNVIHRVTATDIFFNLGGLPDIIEAPIYQNVHYFTDVWILSQLDILSTSAVKILC